MLETKSHKQNIQNDKQAKAKISTRKHNNKTQAKSKIFSK